MDDELRIAMREFVLSILESSLLLSGASMEDSEKQTKVFMGLRDVTEDLFSLEPADRNRTEVEKAVKTFTDRHSEIFQNRLTQEAFNALVDNVCEFIGILEYSTSGP